MIPSLVSNQCFVGSAVELGNGEGVDFSGVVGGVVVRGVVGARVDVLGEVATLSVEENCEINNMYIL